MSQLPKQNTAGVDDRDMKYKLIWAIPGNPSLCPVFAILFHLSLSGALENPDGPMYGCINPKTQKMFEAKGKKTILQRRREVEFWFDEADNRVNFNVFQVEAMSKKIFHGVNLFNCTDHSFRATFAAWGSRLGASLPDILEIGEWSGFNSTEWYKYFEDGIRKRNANLEAHMGVDPLSEIFPWPELGMNPKCLQLNPYSEWLSP